MPPAKCLSDNAEAIIVVGRRRNGFPANHGERLINGAAQQLARISKMPPAKCQISARFASFPLVITRYPALVLMAIDNACNMVLKVAWQSISISHQRGRWQNQLVRTRRKSLMMRSSCSVWATDEARVSCFGVMSVANVSRRVFILFMIYAAGRQILKDYQNSTCRRRSFANKLRRQI